MSVTIALLKCEQRDEVAKAAAGFTCRGPRHDDDETVDHGDAYVHEGVWADADECGVTRTWAAILDGEFAGYIALASDAITLTKSERREAEVGVHFSRYGCTQIAMLAVRADLHGQGVGRALIDHAVLVGRESGGRIGARFLAADVNPPARGFYERCNFVELGGESSKLAKTRERGMIPMVLDLHPRP